MQLLTFRTLHNYWECNEDLTFNYFFSIFASLVTFGGSLLLQNKVFTNELYNANSVQFRNMEKFVCDIVSIQLCVQFKDMKKYVGDMASMYLSTAEGHE